MFEARHIVIANVTAVLTQMRRDAVGPGLDCEQRRTHGVWQRARTRVAQCGDVIDINSEAERRTGHAMTLTVDALDARDDGLGAQLRNDTVEMLEIIDLKIDGQFGKIR